MIDHGNGTVTDPKTGLVWEQRPIDRRWSWYDAHIRIADLNVAGLADHRDWRLPTRAELVTLVDDTRFAPAIDPVFACRSNGYWSATTYQDFPSYAWGVNFYVGYVYAGFKSINYYVRGVRGGS